MGGGKKKERTKITNRERRFDSSKGKGKSEAVGSFPDPVTGSLHVPAMPEHSQHIPHHQGGSWALPP